MNRLDLDKCVPFTTLKDLADGGAHTRLDMLMSRDPFVAMLPYDVRLALVNALFDERLGHAEDLLRSGGEEAAAVQAVHDVFDRSPLQLLGGTFRLHIARLVIAALRGKDTPTEIRNAIGYPTLVDA